MVLNKYNMITMILATFNFWSLSVKSEVYLLNMTNINSSPS